MKCPECKVGDIRVIKSVVCTCGHHPLMCDNCLNTFNVDCGPPFGSNKVPPEFPMKIEKEMLNIIKQRPDMQERLKKEIKAQPLLEDFNKR